MLIAFWYFRLPKMIWFKLSYVRFRKIYRVLVVFTKQQGELVQKFAFIPCTKFLGLNNIYYFISEAIQNWSNQVYFYSLCKYQHIVPFAVHCDFHSQNYSISCLVPDSLFSCRCTCNKTDLKDPVRFVKSTSHARNNIPKQYR